MAALLLAFFSFYFSQLLAFFLAGVSSTYFWEGVSGTYFLGVLRSSSLNLLTGTFTSISSVFSSSSFFLNALIVVSCEALVFSLSFCLAYLLFRSA
jgi:hypothetical protein